MSLTIQDLLGNTPKSGSQDNAAICHRLKYRARLCFGRVQSRETENMVARI